MILRLQRILTVALVLLLALVGLPANINSSYSTGRVIRCRTIPENPHNSIHFKGNVSVNVRLKCTSEVPYMKIEVWLRNLTTKKLAYSRPIEKRNTKFLRAAVWMKCSVKYNKYRAVYRAFVLHPPKSVPPVNIASETSNIISLKCD